jgi:hypothetical protein
MSRARLALLVVLLVACSPAQRQILKARGPSLVARVVCVILRLTTPEGASRAVCATSDELADFAQELLEAKGDAPDAGVAVAATIAIEAKPRRRKCVAWSTTDAGDQGRNRRAAEDRRAIDGGNDDRSEQGGGLR